MPTPLKDGESMKGRRTTVETLRMGSLHESRGGVMNYVLIIGHGGVLPTVHEDIQG